MNYTVLSLVYIIIVFGIFFLLLILPERKRKKQFGEMMKSLKVNDEIVTKGGIVGKVMNIEGDYIILQSGPDKSKIKILKSAVDHLVRNK